MLIVLFFCMPCICHSCFFCLMHLGEILKQFLARKKSLRDCLQVSSNQGL